MRALLIARRRREAIRRERLRRRERRRRWKAFMRRQAQQRLVFVFLLAGISFSVGVGSSARALWAKERSTHWWDHVVNSSFTPQDWLMNFRVSKATFEYLCEQLRSSVTKSDTIMRKAIPTEKRIGLTLWFLATGADYTGRLATFSVYQSQQCVWLPSKYVVLLLNVYYPSM